MYASAFCFVACWLRRALPSTAGFSTGDQYRVQVVYVFRICMWYVACRLLLNVCCIYCCDGCRCASYCCALLCCYDGREPSPRWVIGLVTYLNWWWMNKYIWTGESMRFIFYIWIHTFTSCRVLLWLKWALSLSDWLGNRWPTSGGWSTGTSSAKRSWSRRRPSSAAPCPRPFARWPLKPKLCSNCDLKPKNCAKTIM